MSKVVIELDYKPTLKQWIQIRGLTPKTFAEAVGVGSSTVSGWLAGRHLPNLSKVPDIEKVLGVNKDDVDWLSGA